MRNEIAALSDDMKKEVETANSERAKLAQDAAAKAKALQDALDQLNRAARKSGADLAVDQEQAQNDTTALTGSLSMLQHPIDALDETNQHQPKMPHTPQH